jgi:hypothetical protein
MSIRTVVARRRLSAAETLLETEDFLVKTVVLVAVFSESLFEALLCVVRCHDCCDGDEYTDCYDALDYGDHCRWRGVVDVFVWCYLMLWWC